MPFEAVGVEFRAGVREIAADINRIVGGDEFLGHIAVPTSIKPTTSRDTGPVHEGGVILLIDRRELSTQDPLETSQ
jgi:hypothetical protein